MGCRRNMVLTIGKSCGSKGARHGKVLCRKKMQDCKEGEKKSRVAKSKKCGCIFGLYSREVDKDEWRLEVDCRIHNHHLPPSLGHTFVGQLTEQELLVKDLSASGSKPKSILGKLKLSSGTNVTSRKQIYKARWKLKKES